jgi:hypothetical protein
MSFAKIHPIMDQCFRNNSAALLHIKGDFNDGHVTCYLAPHSAFHTSVAPLRN